MFSVFSVIACCSYTLTGTFAASYSAISVGVPMEIILPSMFGDLMKLGNAAGEAQFINFCFFLRQRFSVLNDNLTKLQMDTRKTKLDHWFNDSSQKAPYGNKSPPNHLMK
ncbi:uncharacterized protein LOC110841429 [Zootermopsis nevadensis]|uniref:uncharacterized protein LOC110841429 n=1 Tax=Zootermopsis nevadensis TaxID=136037 RepID=UPI000B8E842C|nr:uncharacterized protein LOC110841429 [Zootermopsis nevadensis]